MMKKIIVTLLLFTTVVGFAQERNPFYIGHSLVNHDMPNMVQGLAVDAGKTTHYGRQIINGSPLKFNYNSTQSEGTHYTAAFPNGNFNTLIITEAVPIQNHLTWNETYIYANNFYNYAKNNNNGTPIKFYLYETWHCINSGIPQSGPNSENGCEWDNSANSNTLWQPRLLLDFPLWTGILTHVRDQNSSDNQIWMVPAGQAFYNLTTQINAGNVPGISNFRNLFVDDIHLTNAGNYFVACVMYATIYGQSPVGLTTSISNQWGVPFTNMPTTAQALVMQNIAWSTVTGLTTWTGVSEILSNEDFDVKMQKFTIYPTPSTDFITINSNDFQKNETVLIYNSIGQLIKETTLNNKKVPISDLASGVYFIQIKNYTSQLQKFIKK